MSLLDVLLAGSASTQKLGFDAVKVMHFDLTNHT